MDKDIIVSYKKERYTDPIYFHSHDFYEIYFFTDGNVKYYIEDESYELAKGDVLIIPPGKLHRPVIEGDMPYGRYVLWISGGCVSQSKGIGGFMEEITRVTAEKNTRLASFKGEALKALTGAFDKLIEYNGEESRLAQYAAESCIVLILEEILSRLKDAEQVGEESGELIERVISYINRNVTEAPSLEELSAKFFVSKYYLSRKFRERTKTTVHQYILMKKVNLAKELLEKDIPAKEVCERCGFSTYSNFYKAFTVQTGVSPGNFGRAKRRRAERNQACRKAD